MSDYRNDMDAYIRTHFGEGSIYTSITEKQRDFKHPAYNMHTVEGELFRHHVDQKILRSLQAGVRFPNIRDIDPNRDHRMAGAVRNADGTIDAGQTSLDSPNGKTPQRQQEEAEQPPQRVIVNGLPILVKQLPGGTIQVKAASKLEELKPLVSLKKKE